MTLTLFLAKLQSVISAAPSADHFPCQIEEMQNEISKNAERIESIRKLCQELPNYEKQIKDFNPELVEILSSLIAQDDASDLEKIAQRMSKLGHLIAMYIQGKTMVDLNQTYDQLARQNMEYQGQAAALEAVIGGIEREVGRLERYLAQEEKNAETASQLTKEIQALTPNLPTGS